MSDIFNGRPIIPVIEINDPEDAVPLAKALLQGGINIIEVTFRTAAAARPFRKSSKTVPAMLVGAGTVVTPEQVHRALELKVGFGVAPGLNLETVQAFQNAGTPFLPGVATPSEIERALSLGCNMLKFFLLELPAAFQCLRL